MNFESWIYPNNRQQFILSDPPIEKVHWKENEQWSVVELTGVKGNHTYETWFGVEQTFDTVTFYVKMKRKTAHYLYNIILPSIVISLVELVIFLMPTAEIERIPTSFTCLLAYSVFQLIVAQDLPRSSTNTPLLSIYIILQMTYISIALVGEGLVFICIWKSHRLKPIPNLLLSIAKALGPILWLDDISNVGNNVDNDTMTMHHHVVADIPDDDSSFGSVRSSFNESQNMAMATLANFKQVANKGNLDENQKVVAGIIKELSEKMAKSRRNAQIRGDWFLIANIIDRIICICYGLAIILTPLVMFVFVM